MTFSCNLKVGALTTRCDSNWVLADTTSWREDRQTAEWGHQRKRQTMAAFISPPHIPVEERSWPAVWTWGRLVHSVWVMGLPTAIVTTVKDFSSMSVYFIKYFSSLNQQTASVHSQLLWDKYVTAWSISVLAPDITRSGTETEFVRTYLVIVKVQIQTVVSLCSVFLFFLSPAIFTLIFRSGSNVYGFRKKQLLCINEVWQIILNTYFEFLFLNTSVLGKKIQTNKKYKQKAFSFVF